MIPYPFFIDSGPPCNEAQANKVGDTCMDTVSISVFHNMTSYIGAHYGYVVLAFLVVWLSPKYLALMIRRIYR